MVRGSYPPGTSIKCVVHPNCANKRNSAGRKRKRVSAFNFTCDGEFPIHLWKKKGSLNWCAHIPAVTSTVEHITLEVVCNLDSEDAGGGGHLLQVSERPRHVSSQQIVKRRQFSIFKLQVAGTSEYLEPDSQLQDYEYVHECYKYDRDPEFILVPGDRVEKPYLRTVRKTLKCFPIYF